MRRGSHKYTIQSTDLEQAHPVELRQFPVRVDLGQRLHVILVHEGVDSQRHCRRPHHLGNHQRGSVIGQSQCKCKEHRFRTRPSVQPVQALGTTHDVSGNVLPTIIYI